MYLFIINPHIISISLCSIWWKKNIYKKKTDTNNILQIKIFWTEKKILCKIIDLVNTNERYENRLWKKNQSIYLSMQNVGVKYFLSILVEFHTILSIYYQKAFCEKQVL